MPDINRLCSAIGALFGDDPIRTATALKRSMSELVSQLKLHYSWMVNFIDSTRYKNIDFLDDEGSGTAQETFADAISELYGSIRRFEYGNTEDQLENRICRYVLENVDAELSIEGISRVLFMNRKYISEVFRQKTGELLIDYITRVKMARAARLLSQSTRKTYEIALQLGYRDTEYFSRLFKKHMGVTPSEYRNSAIES